MKTLVAMSGGVDSTVAAFLSKKAGDDIGGCYMILNEYITKDGEKEAKKSADNLGIPFYSVDFSETFKKSVLDYFVNEYLKGRTPNPCVECNKHIKFGELIQYAKEMGFEKLTTGHYARIEQKDGRFLLKKAKDLTKDQSYFLYGLTQEQLMSVNLPLGEYTKDEIRQIADENGFENAHKKDSQDICFVPEGKYIDVIEKEAITLPPHGEFVDKDGKVRGEHLGIYRYTFGQRKGLGISADRPLYVCGIDVEKNKVVLGDNEDLFTKEAIINNVNWIYKPTTESSFRAKARLRYCHKEQSATIEIISNDSVRIVFDEPQRAATKGQSAVVYDGDYVVLGGIIE